MKIEMLLPQLGESIAEATILKWHKTVGQAVSKDEVIVEISTDKVDSEIPSPESGVLTEIRVKEGETAPVKSVIAVIDTTGKEDHPSVVVVKEEISSIESEVKQQTSSSTLPTAITQSSLPSTVQSDESNLYSPLVVSLAKEHGVSEVELSRLLPGSGAQGRLTKADLLQYVVQRAPGSPALTNAVKPKESSLEPQYDEKGLRRVPMDRMRLLIAEHMVRSKATSPHVYTVAEVDITNLASWREKNQAAFVGREGFKLSFTPFFLDAAARALRHFPQVNASVEGTDVLMKRDINLGCAVTLGTTGLIVPVIKNADQLTLSGLARSLNLLAEKARKKELQPGETQGGTFTITNPGTFGNILGFPIISQPQLAILGVGAIKKRPAIVNNMIAIRDIVYLTLSYDHRAIDGSLAGQFLQFLAKYLENWEATKPLA